MVDCILYSLAHQQIVTAGNSGLYSGVPCYICEMHTDRYLSALPVMFIANVMACYLKYLVCTMSHIRQMINTSRLKYSQSNTTYRYYLSQSNSPQGNPIWLTGS